MVYRVMPELGDQLENLFQMLMEGEFNPSNCGHQTGPYGSTVYNLQFWRVLE